MSINGNSVRERFRIVNSKLKEGALDGAPFGKSDRRATQTNASTTAHEYSPPNSRMPISPRGRPKRDARTRLLWPVSRPSDRFWDRLYAFGEIAHAYRGLNIALNPEDWTNDYAHRTAAQLARLLKRPAAEIDV
jgi:hypothetical protein